MVEVLGRAGYRSTGASDGEAGWSALRSDRFDALITDHEMPRLSGLELLRRVRAVESAVPVVLASGNLPLGDPELSSLLPPGVALRKPFTLTRLLEALRGLLDPPAPGRLPNPCGQHPISGTGPIL